MQHVNELHCVAFFSTSVADAHVYIRNTVYFTDYGAL